MRFVFITTMVGSPWGGSEELWSQAATRLAKAGHQVAVYTDRQPPLSPKFTGLAALGITVRHPPPVRLLLGVLKARLLGTPGRNKELEWVRSQQPDLVVISQGGNSDGFCWMHNCREVGLPYCSIVQCNSEIAWVDDNMSEPLAAAYRGARAVYCVSRHNLQLLEWQIGEKLPHASVVWNPNNVAASSSMPWPDKSEPCRLACVARLEPGAKGQDVLFKVLAQAEWRDRPIELNLYGAGQFENVLRKMTESLQLRQVHFRGHVANVAEIWRDHHLLVMPSRQEGLPLSLIEAMSCGRPAVVTDVGGNAELCVDGETGFVASAAAAEPFGDALERAWARRAEWPMLGVAASTRVQKLVPADPVDDLCKLLLQCIKTR